MTNTKATPLEKLFLCMVICLMVAMVIMTVTVTDEVVVYKIRTPEEQARIVARDALNEIHRFNPRNRHEHFGGFKKVYTAGDIEDNQKILDAWLDDVAAAERAFEDATQIAAKARNAH